MWTFNQIWGLKSPEEVKSKIFRDGRHIYAPRNLEEQAILLIGKEPYEKLVKGYTEKQWRKKAEELPKEIITRLPVRFTFNDDYFNDLFQGIPVGGYTPIFEKLLKSIDLKLSFDYFNNRIPLHRNLIYTGPIDRFFSYKHGTLEYKTVEFKHVLIDSKNYQGNSVVNYTHKDIPYTRIIEHKHFEKTTSDKTWVTYEYPVDYDPKSSEPFYPVNDRENNNKYLKYKYEADHLKNVYFGGRLAQYKYFDMHHIIREALSFCQNIEKNV